MQMNQFYYSISYNMLYEIFRSRTDNCKDKMLTAKRTSDQVIREYCSGLPIHAIECTFCSISVEMAQNLSGDNI